jgi:hypothetical protein
VPATARTRAVSAARFTEASITPGTRASARSIRVAQLAQVMPPRRNENTASGTA